MNTYAQISTHRISVFQGFRICSSRIGSVRSRRCIHGSTWVLETSGTSQSNLEFKNIAVLSTYSMLVFLRWLMRVRVSSGLRPVQYISIPRRLPGVAAPKVPSQVSRRSLRVRLTSECHVRRWFRLTVSCLVMEIQFWVQFWGKGVQIVSTPLSIIEFLIRVKVASKINRSPVSKRKQARLF